MEGTKQGPAAIPPRPIIALQLDLARATMMADVVHADGHGLVSASELADRRNQSEDAGSPAASRPPSPCRAREASLSPAPACLQLKPLGLGRDSRDRTQQNGRRQWMRDVERAATWGPLLGRSRRAQVGRPSISSDCARQVELSARWSGVPRPGLCSTGRAPVQVQLRAVRAAAPSIAAANNSPCQWSPADEGSMDPDAPPPRNADKKILVRI
jgi:hypothetical protein